MKNKIAVFVCGSGGSGKSTISSQYFPNFTIIDVDIIYEELLIKNGLNLKIIDYTLENRLLADNLFESAKELNNQKFNEEIKKGSGLVIDTIGRDPNVILEQRNILTKMGYSTFMLMVYSELETCIDRVRNRDRVYGDNITIDSWYQSYSKIDIYKKEFKEKFILIYNEIGDLKERLEVFIYKYIDKKTII